jgi:hypothetical protein
MSMSATRVALYSCYISIRLESMWVVQVPDMCNTVCHNIALLAFRNAYTLRLFPTWHHTYTLEPPTDRSMLLKIQPRHV